MCLFQIFYVAGEDTFVKRLASLPVEIQMKWIAIVRNVRAWSLICCCPYV